MWMLDALWTLFLGLAVTVGPFVLYALIKGFYQRWRKRLAEDSGSGVEELGKRSPKLRHL